ncbi:hypothetical protein NYR72_01690 [Actinobacillus equuli subsp. haemolyticus]|uniref:DUF6602 domain-containing protein n=1 Tax=Actinobacillus equuli TaxID=718 RepID=UPI0024185A49|nr:DUF6602 domain-containing protein [Actinobacillus equuli]MDG4947369.1 hypothetical protein [Actinobacillus equuli subsp. haemolyticus]
MDGERIQNYWSTEVKALLETYRQFEILIPSKNTQGSAHNGEDGRFVESLIKEYIKKFLPKGLEVLTGFILRPAVKTGIDGRERKDDEDKHSTQLDIIIYNSSNYPIFQRFGDSVIVPPEGVIAILSIKKTLKTDDIKKELEALKNASELCECNNGDQKLRKPYLALISMRNNISNTKGKAEELVFEKIKNSYCESDNFESVIGYIGSLDSWSIFKKRPNCNKPDQAEFVYLKHENTEMHLGLQFILTGILSVYYDKTRNSRNRPGFTAFPSNRPHNKSLGVIHVKPSNIK